jgi:hypothetical protein
VVSSIRQAGVWWSAVKRFNVRIGESRLMYRNLSRVVPAPAVRIH